MSSPAPQFKRVNSSVLSFILVQLLHLYVTTGKTTALTIQTFVGKLISLLFNSLSRFVIAFLPRSKCFLISWLQSTFAVILEPKKIKSDTVSTFFPIYLPWKNGTGCHDLSFWTLSFKTAFSLSSFTLIKRLFTSSSHSAIRVVSSVYLRLFIFLPAILIPPYSSSLAFCIIYTAYKLNKHSDDIQPWHAPFTFLKQSVVPWLVLTIASWPVHRFLRRQVRWSGTPISLRIFHSLLLSTQRLSTLLMKEK